MANRRQRRKRAKRIIREWVPFAQRDWSRQPLDPEMIAAFSAGLQIGLAKRGLASSAPS